MIKAHNAQRTKATVPLVKEARRAILLSGTPALNKPIEIFQQVCSVWALGRMGGTFCDEPVLCLRHCCASAKHVNVPYRPCSFRRWCLMQS